MGALYLCPKYINKHLIANVACCMQMSVFCVIGRATYWGHFVPCFPLQSPPLQLLRRLSEEAVRTFRPRQDCRSKDVKRNYFITTHDFFLKKHTYIYFLNTFLRSPAQVSLSRRSSLTGNTPGSHSEESAEKSMSRTKVGKCASPSPDHVNT